MERNVSIDRCRKILGPKLSGSDENLATIREHLYCLAGLIFDVRDDQRKSRKEAAELLELAANSEQELEILQERASIIEFDGGVSRDEAERTAINFSLENDRVN